LHGGAARQRPDSPAHQPNYPYDKGIIYIKRLLTHAEYDRDKWKT